MTLHRPEPQTSLNSQADNSGFRADIKYLKDLAGFRVPFKGAIGFRV